jgi:histidinol-phosphatase (PHP family)
LQAAYAPQIHLLIGFEGEWIRPAYGALITSLAADARVDYFIGSLHHVNGVPIDFDTAHYQRAVATTAEATERGLFARYYDQQLEMLTALRPRVVGHFDLCRLMCASAPPAVPDVRRDWPDVWDRVVRNLQFVASYGGWLECNTSALRKGLAEPYPCRDIAEVT